MTRFKALFALFVTFIILLNGCNPIGPLSSTPSPFPEEDTPIPATATQIKFTLTPTPHFLIAGTTPPGTMVATSMTEAQSGELPESQWFSRVTFKSEIEYTYQGGIVILSGSPDKLATFVVDDAIQMVIRHLDGTFVVLDYDDSANCTKQLSDIGPFRISDYLQPGLNIIEVKVIDMCGPAWSIPYLWLLEFTKL